MKEKNRLAWFAVVIVAFAVALAVAFNVFLILLQINENVWPVKDTAQIAIPASAEQIGYQEAQIDNESLLSYDAVLYYDEAAETYYLEVKVRWKKEFSSPWNVENTAEENYEDYLAISWGGALRGKYSAQGTYWNDKPVQISRCYSNLFCGVIFQFYEKSGFLGKELREATFRVALEKPEQKEGLQTNIRVAYCHTYGGRADIDFYGIDESSAPGMYWTASGVAQRYELAFAGIEY